MNPDVTEIITNLQMTHLEILQLVDILTQMLLTLLTFIALSILKKKIHLS